MVHLDPDKSCQDCVDIIKQQDPEKKMKLLAKAIQEAEAQGDAGVLARLMDEQNELSKRPDRKLGKRVPGM